MDTIQDQIRALQTSVRRQRFAIVTLASILAGSALIGAVRPAGDATFDTITCKGWAVVDKAGKERIFAGTIGNGTAAVTWRDKDGKGRIFVNTADTGDAGVTWFDKDEQPRFFAGTLANGMVMYPTKDGK